MLKVGIDEVVTPSPRRIQNRRAPSLAAVLDPVLELLGDITEALASNSLSVAIGIKEADHSLGLLERLNQSVQKDSVIIDATLILL